jgi:membrane protein DedA with SNARE-associated domain
MTPHLLEIIQAHVHWAPYLIFGALMLAGFNLPVSEDVMIFFTAMLATEYPEHLWPLFFGLFAGAFLSDIPAYWIGRLLGPRFWRIPWFARVLTKRRLQKMHHHFKDYGILTLIVGRFIPFGFRQALFMTAGLSHMNFVKFFTGDFIASTLSVTTYFLLYYHVGYPAIRYIHKSNKFLFFGAIAFLLIVFLTRQIWKVRNPRPPDTSSL